MKYTVNENFSRGWVIAAPEVEGGYLGAYTYPDDAKELEDPRRIMVFGLKANILGVRPVDLDRIREGDLSTIDRYVEPIPEQAGIYIVHQTCHLQPLGRDTGINVFKYLHEFAPHPANSTQDLREAA